MTQPAAPVPPATTGTDGADAAVVTQTFPAGEARGELTDYDLAAALKALNRVYYGACAVSTPGKVVVTFAPSGRVKQVDVVQGDYDSETAGCVAARFGAARMPPFRGGAQQVTANLAATR